MKRRRPSIVLAHLALYAFQVEAKLAACFLIKTSSDTIFSTRPLCQAEPEDAGCLHALTREGYNFWKFSSFAVQIERNALET